MTIDIQNILTYIAGSGGIIGAIMLVVQIAPIRFNPWSFVLNKLGQMMTRGVIDEVKVINGGMEERLHQEIVAVRDELAGIISETDAVHARYRIIRFHDEILQGVRHSKDHFDQILEMIDICETYCKDHNGFMTNQCHSSCSHIKEVYDERLRKRDFTIIKKEA